MGSCYHPTGRETSDGLKPPFKVKTNNCKYCKGKEMLRSCNFCGSGKMRILGKYMDIFGDEKNFHLFKRIYHPSFLINYCPMCGRRLGDE